MPEESTNSRCRMLFSQSAKGLWQIDVTVEYDTPEESAQQAQKAIDEAHRVATEKGLQLAGS